ncbi:hypothetical protein T440DRAFT_532115 [Plenodomus tracheiphilus IPT5]|uniref:Rhodopsin domain-containing protein n=1 Tax=Plenodomus tracheiphilus IPT5 TaxID=1408161 RepID=A0A6A7B7F5_9PLEO|nr:hypothetical protein T440DRAFT_532115 [Plenodomus tracheiphilus IPT5]
MAPWPSMPADLKFTSEVMWCSGMLYWTCLWFVKFSLLALYKKLLLGMPNAYRWTWWATLIFCVLTWATCIITGPGLACDNTKKFFNEGVLCSSPAEVRRQTANLYYAYAVDVLTNLMVMFLPIKLIWSIAIKTPKKIGCFLLFASGFVCILFSTLRIVQVGGDGKPRSPDPKWLTMWTMIECSTAIIIGCCPVLAVLIPKSKTPGNRVSYDASGYVRQTPSRPNGSASNSHRLRAMMGPKNRTVGISTNRSAGAEDPNASQEKLPERRNDGKGILITRELREEHERRTAAQANSDSTV